MGPIYRDTGRRAPPTRRNRGSMSTVTTIGVVDLLTIRECIEILVDRRTGRDRTAFFASRRRGLSGSNSRETKGLDRRSKGSAPPSFDYWGGRPLCKPEDRRRHKCCI